MAFDIPSPFQWDNSFDVHNATLNEQHKNLFRLISALEADKANASILKELLDLVVLHFKQEEDGFAAKGWAGAADHKAIHDKFVQDALNVKSVDDGVIQFLKNWLVHHIKGSDFQYIDILKD